MTPNQCAYQAVAARRSLPHGQRPTDLHIRVAFLLARWQHPSPPHAKLALAAHCHRRSVGNALHRLRDLGLLNWERQFIRLRGGHVAQTANHYAFTGQLRLPPMDKVCRPSKEPKESKRLMNKLWPRLRPILPVRSVQEQLAILMPG
jgi:hypothetical protein